ncbi:hypothetical protein HZH68_004895 [Vespula germanica]|uniref:Uncharacterized protein n=1 Tax=Vespula germanica TaxID=30212 RepID=A0A834KM76_VESGE|nr:hypothetical protein HZH68_004895 [Vespula germanica]
MIFLASDSDRTSCGLMAYSKPELENVQLYDRVKGEKRRRQGLVGSCQVKRRDSYLKSLLLTIVRISKDIRDMALCVKSFFLIYLSILPNVLTENTTKSPEENNSKSFEESTEDNLPHEEDFTTEATLFIATETHENLLSTIVLESDTENITDEFKPSVHLGEIEEPRTKNNPFNNVHHVNFENNLDVGSHQDDLRNVKQRILYDVKEHQDGRILFDDDKRNFHIRKYQQVLPNHETIQPFHVTVTQSSRSHLDNFGEQKVISDHTFLQNLEKPVYVEEHTSMIFEKPMRFPNELQEHLPLGNGNFDDKNTFYFVPDYRLVPNQNNYYSVEQQEGNYGNVQKANNMMVYLAQQHEYTTLRKQPHYYYYYYQPVGYQEMDFLGEPKPTMLYPKEHRISPWRKIIHLIGSFLPWGLLLAALAPNVIKIQNTTDPNIVLSKLRVVDLPIEHKQARLLDEQRANVCEERSICELILAGGKPRTNIVQNVLWNLAIRSNEDTARKIGLQEIFEAVKKKSCATIGC